MIPSLSIDRFYQLCREAVMYYPKPSDCNDCHRPKTFAVIDHIEEINFRDLKKSFRDHDKKFFYSERWADTGFNPNNVIYDYPLVTNTFVGGTFADKGSSKNLNATIHVACYDIIRDEGNKTSCEDRLHHEIERDCMRVLSNVLGYLRTVIYADFEGVSDYYSETFLEFQKTQDKTYTKIATPKFIATSDDSYYVSTLETGVEHTYGAVMKLRVKLGFCDDNNYNFEKCLGKNELDNCG